MLKERIMWFSSFSASIDILGACLIYSHTYAGLDLECQLEQPYSLDISSQLAEQWPD